MIKSFSFSALFIVLVIGLSIPILTFAQTTSTSSQSSQEKIVKKIQERIKKTKNRLQYIDRYGSWNDAKTTEYYQKTRLVFNRMLSLGEICDIHRDVAKMQECDTQTKQLYDAAKAGYRLTKYYAIVSGKSNTCVMANLGSKPIREGTPVEGDKTPFGNRPQSLFLCSGPESSPISLDLRWRVLAKDGGMVKIKENYRSDPKDLAGLQNQDNVVASSKMVEEVLSETK